MRSTKTAVVQQDHNDNLNWEGGHIPHIIYIDTGTIHYTVFLFQYFQIY